MIAAVVVSLSEFEVAPEDTQQPLSLAANDFELFDLPQCFELNRSELDNRWKKLQRQVHPDQFVSQGAAAQRLAMQWSVRINEAYQRLKSPLQRAAYLCELNGSPVQADDNTSMSSDFLMLQMQWREALDDAGTLQALTALETEIQQHRAKALAQLAHCLDVTHRWDEAVCEVRALMFVDKFEQDLHRQFERLENA